MSKTDEMQNAARESVEPVTTEFEALFPPARSLRFVVASPARDVPETAPSRRAPSAATDAPLPAEGRAR